MSPIVHGRIYPEIQPSGLLRYRLRILIDPKSVKRVRSVLLEIDTLHHYLSDLKSPCQVVMLAPAQISDQAEEEYNFLRSVGIEVLPSSSIIVPEIASYFPNLSDVPTEFLALASTAKIGGADIVLSEDLVDQEKTVNMFRSLNIELLTANATKRNCEVFVRGHEIPWSFTQPVWNIPWSVFYPMTDPDIRIVINLSAMAYEKGIDPGVQEQIRLLALNRWSAIDYTRDKLLFFKSQRNAVKREGLEKQNFTFELSYFLNHYYLLFWGGLEQICWIVNGVFGLGFTPDNESVVGVRSGKFINRLKRVSPETATEFENKDFLDWVSLLGKIRRYCGHHGIALLRPAYKGMAKEPSEADIDKELEQWPEWRELVALVGPEVMEAFRPTFRIKCVTQKAKMISDAAFPILTGSKFTAFLPLENIDWDFENFKKFVLGVVNKCKAHLSSTPGIQ